MPSQLTRYLAVGLIVMTLTGAVLVGESSAQWGRFAQPYYVNYNANYYPAYVAWRPFGGLFAGIHGVLCHRCWQSPCCCVTPFCYDPCFDPCGFPCFDPCNPCGDFCCNSFGSAVGSCGCSDNFGYYDQPKSLSLGTQSPTGFGSVTPSDVTPGQRPVGTPTTQRPYSPPDFQSPQLTTPYTRPRTYSTPNNSQNDEPTLAPPQQPSNETGSETTIDSIESRLQGIPAREPYVPGSFSGSRSYSSGDADNPPSTGGIDREWINNSNPSTGGGQQSEPDNTTTPGGRSTNNLKLDLGSGTISVTVPENAKVFINGYETKLPGVNRSYVVNDLEPGMLYEYEVRIVAQVNGRTVEDTQVVTLTSGQRGMVAFGKPQQQSDNMRYIAARPAQ